MPKPFDPVMTGFFPNAVTEGDTAAVGSTPGVFNFIIPIYGGSYLISQLPTECPPHVPNNKHRDTLLSITPFIEGLWSDAVNISANKIIARGDELTGKDSDLEPVYNMLENCDTGLGMEKYKARHLIDFKTTDNGAWTGFIREADMPGSPVVSFYHMDSLRCWRTGDPETPLYYYDLKGRYHVLKWWECYNIVDMSSPRAGFYNSGLCAASRSWREIRQLAALSIYLDEKLTGGGATELSFIQGVTPKQVEDANTIAESNMSTKGVIYYKGKVIIPILSDTALNKAEINLKGVPDGFEYEVMLRVAALKYTKSLGLKPTDLDPQLTARGALGVGQAEQIQDDNVSGYGDGNWERQFTKMFNRFILPQSVNYAVASRSLRDEQLEAAVVNSRAEARDKDVANGTITPAQSLQTAIDAGDYPPEFLTTPDSTPETTVSDDEQLSQQTAKEIDEIRDLKDSMEQLTLEIKHAKEAVANAKRPARTFSFFKR